MINQMVQHSKFGEKSIHECLVLPTVDEDVNAGVKDQEDGGDDGHHLTPEQNHKGTTSLNDYSHHSGHGIMSMVPSTAR